MKQNYTKIPGYVNHDSQEDVLNVLVCQIKVWSATAPDWHTIPDKCTIITEVEEIEISETYKELISSAIIRLPKGAVISDTILNKNIDDQVETGNKTKQDIETSLSQSSNIGELLTIDDVMNGSGEYTLLIDERKSDGGLVQTKNKKRIASQNDFMTGNRIQIELGYVYQPQEGADIITEKLEKVRRGEHISELQLAFTGFITGCSVSSPLEIECENMASVLKKTSSRKGVFKGNYTVNDFLVSSKDGGKYGLLDGTGIVLSESTKSQNLPIVNLSIVENTSVSDLLYNWKNSNLFCKLSRDGKELRVGGFTVSEDDWMTDKSRIDYTDNPIIEYIQSDWDVVSDSLQVTYIDKEFIVINAKAKVMDEKGKDPNNKKDFRVLVGKVDGEFRHDIHDSRVRKKQKRKKGQSDRPEVVSKFDPKKYTFIDYTPINVKDMNTLIKKAEEYWNSYSPNGISGSITIFGNMFIEPAQIIGLINVWNPERNGHYFVESVKTTFGVNGFRQTLKLPYKMSDFNKPIKVIE